MWLTRPKSRRMARQASNSQQAHGVEVGGCWPPPHKEGESACQGKPSTNKPRSPSAIKPFIASSRHFAMMSKRATVGNIAMRLSRIASQSEIIQPGSTAQHVLHNVTRAAAWNFIALQPPAIPPLSATCEVQKPACEKCPRGVRKPSAAGPQTS